MSDAMTRFGVGPEFSLLSAGCLIVATGLRLAWPDLFRIDFVPYKLLVTIGVVLIAIGLPFYIMAVMTVMKAFDAGRLCTHSVFRCCRHPVYASWVVFLVPGIVLLMNSWVGLIVPVVMYVLLRLLVRREEAYLEQRFGDEYRAYRDRVPAVAPLGWLRGSGKGSD